MARNHCRYCDAIDKTMALDHNGRWHGKGGFATMSAYIDHLLDPDEGYACMGVREGKPFVDPELKRQAKELERVRAARSAG